MANIKNNEINVPVEMYIKEKSLNKKLNKLAKDICKTLEIKDAQVQIKVVINIKTLGDDYDIKV